MNDQEMKEKIMKDPGASYWLKDAVRAAEDRDPVDALRDARILAEYNKKRIERILKENEKMLQNIDRG